MLSVTCMAGEAFRGVLGTIGKFAADLKLWAPNGVRSVPPPLPARRTLRCGDDAKLSGGPRVGRGMWFSGLRPP